MTPDSAIRQVRSTLKLQEQRGYRVADDEDVRTLSR